MKKNYTIAGVLAIVLGALGIHRFYLGEWKIGLLFLLFSWTGIPAVVGIIDGVRYFTKEAES